MNDEQNIRRLITDWAAAVRAHDLTGILANHSPDILMFDVPPPIAARGLDAYMKTWDVFFSWAQDAGVFDIDEMEVTAGETAAFATALMRCAGTENGKRTKLRFRLTVGLRKIDGRWIVTHEHHSVPVEAR